MTLAAVRTTPRGWYRWEAEQGIWVPGVANNKADWENYIICEVFKPNAMGVSNWIGYEQLRTVYARLCPDNPERALALFGGPGGNGSNFFTRPTHAASEFAIVSRPGHRREETKFNGIASNVTPTNQGIPTAVRNVITSQDCAFTGLHNKNIVVDHKDGRHNTGSAAVDDFQPLLNNINKLKGTHCKSCITTNRRFDARLLGYSIGWTHGDAVYQGTCVGCYWYDIHAFRSSLILPPDHEP
jgi:hypothetical protein